MLILHKYKRAWLGTTRNTKTSNHHLIVPVTLEQKTVPGLVGPGFGQTLTLYLHQIFATAQVKLPQQKERRLVIRVYVVAPCRALGLEGVLTALPIAGIRNTFKTWQSGNNL